MREYCEEVLVTLRDIASGVLLVVGGIAILFILCAVLPAAFVYDCLYSERRFKR